MVGPQNAVMGEDFGMSLPETQVNQDTLVDEKRRAKFSKTAEFKILRAHLEERIKHYQSFLPGGGGTLGLSTKEVGEMWQVADKVIMELRGIISSYDDAVKAVRAGKKDV